MFKFLKKIVSPFAKIGSRLGSRIRSLFSKEITEDSFEELEKIFYEADLGVELSSNLVELVKKTLQANPSFSTDQILDVIQKELLEILGPTPNPVVFEKTPHVILVVGVNGGGKTTSIAKLAFYFRKQGKKVLIGAADTFRAASVEQLETWATRAGADLVKSQPNSDPAAVAFDALSAGIARKSDVVLIDTAGRLQTKIELMHELAKIQRTCQKLIAEAPHETLLVLDATIGQNALDQAMTFHKFTPLTGAILTKLDGSSKGGIAIAVKKQLQIPIQWIGIGEQIGDFEPFDPKAFVEALLSIDKSNS